MSKDSEKLRLYKVTLQGFYGKPIGQSMVVAKDPTAAYKVVRAWLDEHDYGFRSNRQLKSVELVAETYAYTDAPSRLFLPGNGT